MPPAVVLFPGLGVSHLNPVVELSKLLVARGLSVTVVLTSDASRVAAANPSISFHTLPPPATFPDLAGKSPFAQMIDILGSYSANLLSHLRTIPDLTAVVLHFFCFNAFDAVQELHLPTYFYYTSGTVDLAVFSHLQYYPDALTSPPFKNDPDGTLSFPFAPPFKVSDLPKECLDEAISKYTYSLFNKMLSGRGILTNTFDALEPAAVAALRGGAPEVIPGGKLPPVYCVGPLVGPGEGGTERHECLTFLDGQPDGSVVFIAFGSMGALSAPELQEMAAGLESSGVRFVWAVRSPKPDDPNKFFDPLPPPDLNALLPEGFLERTKERGMVIKSWAPQMEILRHRAAGAFVSHCGWNSSLEGLTSGVPLICWPQYAEQRLNKVIAVDAGIGVGLEGYDKGMVTADEICKKLKLVMESEEGEAIRRRVLELKAAGEAALKAGGSSAVAVDLLVEDMKKR